MRVEWAEPAELDLGDIYAYIARDVPIYAEQFVDQIIETVDLLHEHPPWVAKCPKLNATMCEN
jgi:plasmid stabilization system protein ParE